MSTSGHDADSHSPVRPDESVVAHELPDDLGGNDVLGNDLDDLSDCSLRDLKPWCFSA